MKLLESIEMIFTALNTDFLNSFENLSGNKFLWNEKDNEKERWNRIDCAGVVD